MPIRLCHFIFLWWLFGLSSSACSNCFDYVLRNECTTLLVDQNVSISPNEQQDFFDEYVSLNVSDVRMARESCRRPFLSYYCQLMFGSFSCMSSSQEEQNCLEEEFCVQVSDLCSDDFQLACSSSFSPTPSSPSPSPSPTLDCSEEVEDQIEEVKKKPIKVQTCLNGLKETIECCLDPFIFDDNDECVVECPQYVCGQSWEKGARIFSFVLCWLELVVWISAFIPMVMMIDLSYPNYLVLVSCGFAILANFFCFWVVFGGGPYSFLCRGEKNYLKELEHFGHSTRSFIQYSLWVLFTLLYIAHWTLFTFNLFCHATRPYTTYFEKFNERPASFSIILMMEGLCIGIPISIFLSILIYWIENEQKVFFVPFPYSDFPMPESGVAETLYLAPLPIFGLLNFIFVVLTAILFTKRGRHIFHYQWRSFFAVVYSVIISLVLLVVNFLPNPTHAVMFDYFGCVASHPRLDPSPCERQFNPPYDIIASCLLIGVPLTLLIVVFWTNPLIWRWWKSFIFSREILSSLGNEQQLSINEASLLIKR